MSRRTTKILAAIVLFTVAMFILSRGLKVTLLPFVDWAIAQSSAGAVFVVIAAIVVAAGIYGYRGTVASR